MSKDPKNIKDIDDYLSGELNPQNREEFEKKLKTDIDLQEELDTIKNVVEGIQGYGLKQMLKEIHSRNFTKDTE
jgi:anti-sigma factor RsiW